MDRALPPEVIETILSQLDDDLKTLLKCRLVCRSWNTECLTILRRSKFRKTVDSSDLEKIVQFVSSQEGQFILPFRLEQNLQILEPETPPSEFDDQCVQEFHETSLAVAQLFEVCGPDCLPDYDLTFHFGGVRALVALNEFLKIFGANLKTFDLSFYPSSSLSWRETVEILRADPVLFPNLNALTCDSSFCQGQDEVEAEQENIESVLIENSHNLQILSLLAFGFSDQEEKDYDVFNLWPKGPPAALKTLKKLAGEDIGNRAQFLASLRASPFDPILQEFEFSTTICRDDEIYAMEGILLFFAKTLKKIVVILDAVCDGDSVAFSLRFPAMPQLEHLCLIFNGMYGLSFVSPLEFNFSQETFPNLRSVQIPFGCMINPPMDPLNKSAAQDLLVFPATTFPTVRHLTFRVDDDTFEDKSGYAGKLVTWEDFDCEGVGQLPSSQRISAQSYLELVSRTFPAVTAVKVFNCYKTDVKVENMEIVVKEILQSRLGSSVETVEIQEFEKDCFRNILEAVEFANGMTNLKKLRIGSRDGNFCRLCFILPEEHSEPPPGIQIQQIEIYSDLLGENEAERLENVGVVQAKFPTWKVQLV